MSYTHPHTQFPEVHHVQEFYEPVVVGTLVTPDDYLGKLLQLCQVRSTNVVARDLMKCVMHWSCDYHVMIT